MNNFSIDQEQSQKQGIIGASNQNVSSNRQNVSQMSSSFHSSPFRPSRVESLKEERERAKEQRPNGDFCKRDNSPFAKGGMGSYRLQNKMEDEPIPSSQFHSLISKATAPTPSLYSMPSNNEFQESHLMINTRNLFVNSFQESPSASLTKNGTGIKNNQNELSNASMAMSLAIHAPSFPSFVDPISMSSSFKQEILSRVTNKIGVSKGENGPNELDIVRDLLYVFQGIDGTFIKFNKEVQSYEFINALNMPLGSRKIIEGVAELGWQFCKISSFLEKSSLSSSGLVHQGFCCAVREELCDYYRLVALLESTRESLADSTKNNRDQMQNENFYNGPSENKGRISGNEDRWLETQAQAGKRQEWTSGRPKQTIGLRKLALWTFEPMDRLKWLNIICQEVGNTQGGELISLLSTHAQQGSPVVQEMMKRILRQALTPMVRFIKQWVSNGELFNPMNEFFISNNSDMKTEASFWFEKYSLIVRKIPSVISLECAQKILQAGKSMVFLKKHCSDRDWQLFEDFQAFGNDFLAVLPNKREKSPRMQRENQMIEEEVPSQKEKEAFMSQRNFKVPGISFKESQWLFDSKCKMKKLDLIPEMLQNRNFNEGFGAESFSYWLNTHSEAINRRLVYLMLTKFNLLKHFDAIRQFLLFGQGDFIQALMDILFSVLSRSATELNRHLFVGSLETAIRSSNAQFCDSEYLSRLHVHLFESKKGGENGWDIFSLEYQVTQPLSTVIHPLASECYLKLFNFLWRTQSMYLMLNKIWKKHMKNSGKLRDDFHVEKIIRFSNVVRHQLFHFISSFLSYLMVEVIEGEFNQLIEKLKQAKSLDQLINEHDCFLAMVMRRSMLSFNNAKHYTCIVAIFDCVQRFWLTQDDLFKDVDFRFTTKKQHLEFVWYNKRQCVPTDAQERADAALEAEIENQKFEEDMEEYREKLENHKASLQEIWGSFRKTFFELIGLIEKDESCKLLATKLDFNEFYKAEKDNEQIKNYKLQTEMAIENAMETPSKAPPSLEFSDYQAGHPSKMAIGHEHFERKSPAPSGIRFRSTQKTHSRMPPRHETEPRRTQMDLERGSGFGDTGSFETMSISARRSLLYGNEMEADSPRTIMEKSEPRKRVYLGIQAGEPKSAILEPMNLKNISNKSPRSSDGSDREKKQRETKGFKSPENNL